MFISSSASNALRPSSGLPAACALRPLKRKIIFTLASEPPGQMPV